MQEIIAQRLKRIDLIFSGALVVFIGCTVCLGVVPMYNARAHNLSETQRLQSEIGKLGDLSLTVARAQADVQVAQKRLAAEESRLPSSRTMDQFMTELAKVADTAGLQVDAVTPRPMIDAGVYGVMPVKITGVGSYAACYKFLIGLRAMERLARLDDLQLQIRHDEKNDTPKSPICEISVDISTFVVR